VIFQEVRNQGVTVRLLKIGSSVQREIIGIEDSFYSWSHVVTLRKWQRLNSRLCGRSG